MDLTPLPADWAARDTIEAAIDLIGKILVVQKKNEEKKWARIVETEAYLGPEDPACHTFGHRRTPRTEPMYGSPGIAYVYLVYGIYYCLNVVTGGGEAVLIRALQPLHGFTKEQKEKKSLSGPGKLCRELGITKELNHSSLFDPANPVFIAEDQSSSPSRELILISSRVGVDYAGDAAHWPLRFGLKGSSFLSKRFP